MKALTTFASAAAIALSISAAAIPAHAAVFAQFDPNTNTSDYKWVIGAGGLGGSFYSVDSNSDTSAQGVDVQFSFIEPTFDALKDLDATFTINATAASNQLASEGSAGTWTQPGLTGDFSLIYNGPDQTLGAFTLTTGENLLSGSFANAWIQGAGGTGSTNVTIGNGGSATYTSDVINFSNVVPGSEEFSFNLGSVNPHFGANPNKSLNSFTANGGGNFSALGVPEPATWGLMIIGFGGMGALLRSNRRRQAIATA
jgi:hypothetical protein